MPHQCTECNRTFPDGSKQMLAGCPDCGGNKFQFRPKGTVSVPEEPTSEPDTTERKESTKPRTANTRTTKTRTTTLREWARKKVSPSAGSTTDAAGSTSDTTPTRTTQSAGTSGTRSSGSEAGQSTATAKLDSFREPTGSTDEEEATDPTEGGEVADETEGGELADPSDDGETVDGTDIEDTAQADARSGVVAEDELPERSATGGEDLLSKSENPSSENLPSSDRTPGDSRPADPHPADPHSEDLSAEGPPSESLPTGDHESRPDLSQLREELNDQFESIKIVEPGQYELNLMELYDREEYIIALQENGRYVIEVPDAWDATDT